MLFGAAAAQAQPSPTSAQPFAGGTLTRWDRFPSAQVEPRTVYVWTPRGYAEGRGRHDVLYMTDGQNLFLPAEAYSGQTWQVAEHLQALIDAHKVRPTIIVGVWNTPRRGSEYAPAGGQTPEDLALIGREWNGGPVISDRYVAFLASELKPFVDHTYRTDPRPPHTFAMGSSMGGLISLYAFVSRPDVFGGAACLSTHWPIRGLQGLSDVEGTRRIADAYLHWIDAHLPPADHHRLYFDHGTADLDSHYAPFQQEMDAILSRHGYVSDRNAMSLVFPGATHNEVAWRARLDQPLEFLLGRR
jgi:enterochelin esterase-like enzyme